MSILKKVNILRRTLMHRLTKNIGSSHLNQNVDPTVKVKRVLICRPNHRLGNLLLITPLVQEVITTFPECKIDLFVKGNVAPTIFKNYKNIDRIIQLPRKPFKQLFQYLQGWTSIKTRRYDIVINVSKNSSSGRLSAQFANSRYKFFGDPNEEILSRHKDYAHIAKYPVYNFRDSINGLGFTKKNNKQLASNKQLPSLDLKLSSFEIAEGQKILKNLVNNEEKTICLFTYATGHKCYSESWWEVFYNRLKKDYHDYNIIEVLPIENISKIGFKAPTFYSKDIRQIGSLIANTEVFIGADSGMMHLASAVQTDVIGLFSVTDKNTYQPYNNNSIGINVNKNGISKCIKALNKILLEEAYGISLIAIPLL